MKFNPSNYNNCFLCGDKILTGYDYSERIELDCINRCFNYTDGKSFITSPNMLAKSRYNINIYFYCLEASYITINFSRKIILFDIINKEEIKQFSNIEIINKVINYCENLIFL
jgi:hypothetical protein